jgi:hypothetical protein
MQKKGKTIHFSLSKNALFKVKDLYCELAMIRGIDYVDMGFFFI